MTPPGPREAAAAIARRLPGAAAELGLVLGSGLGGLAALLADPVVLPFAEIPGFRVPLVEGHAGRLLLGRLQGLRVACLEGRVHPYEGVTPAEVRLPIQTLRLLGCRALLVTNAAGSLRPDMPAGSLMLIADHLNLQGFNPLVGPNDDSFGPRFPALDDAYDPGLRALFREAAKALGLGLPEGVYAACLGPSFETPAEIRALIRLGADAVGMSTVAEVIAARHCGMRVAALSAIVDLAAGLGGAAPSHAQTLKAAAVCAERLGRLIPAALARWTALA